MNTDQEFQDNNSAFIQFFIPMKKQKNILKVEEAKCRLKNSEFTEKNNRKRGPMSYERSLLTIPTRRGYEISCLDGSIPGQKAIILCLHGFSGSKRSYTIERLHQEMQSEQIGTFCFDWPAHGESKAPVSQLKIESCLKDLEEVCSLMVKQYSVPIHCFATSFGVYLLSLYRGQHPDDFEKVLLRSPALKMDKAIRSFMDEDQFNAFLEGKPMELGLSQPLAVDKNFLDDICRHDAYNLTPPHPDRMLMIQGEADLVVSPQDSFMYAKRYGITIHMLEGTDHIYSKPGAIDQVMTLARNFFR